LVNFSIAQRCVRDLRVALLDQMNRLSPDYHEQMRRREADAHRARCRRDCIWAQHGESEHSGDSVLCAEPGNDGQIELFMTLTVLPLMPLFAIVQRRFTVLLKTRARKR